MNTSFENNTGDRQIDFRRHLEDLRLGSYEGTEERTDKERVFRKATELLAPVTCGVLDDFNRLMLSGSGDIEDTKALYSEDGTLYREWHLSWPGQRSARRRIDGSKPIEPIIVRAHFPPGWTHGHLSGSKAGNWPLQILTEADANRQALIIWAIAEAEFHERIFESVHPWECVAKPLGTA